MCFAIEGSCVFVRVSQTFIGLFWDAGRVQSCETCLVVAEVILKNKSGQIMTLQPRQQIFCMNLFAKRDGEQEGVRAFMAAHS